MPKIGSDPLSPLPITDDEVIRLAGVKMIRRGLELRRLGLSYRSIAIVMNAYHGDVRGLERWRNMLRYHGAPPAERGGGTKNLKAGR